MCISYRELQHPWILVSSGGPGTNSPWILRDDYITFSLIIEHFSLTSMAFKGPRKHHSVPFQCLLKSYFGSSGKSGGTVK